MSKYTQLLLGLLLFIASYVNAVANDDKIHVGVQTCASSTCHASDKPWQHSSILQNEYITWSKYDRHSKSYKTLLSEKSQRIANRLGLGNASESKLCLDCHADNVDVSQRGKRFKLEDGVQCEVCHGGARKWLGPHASGVNTREENIQAGMYPTENPTARAKLCLSCHLGEKDKQVTHDLYIAGHPRLRFELDTYTIGQPAHFKSDEDYSLRKNNPGSVKVWAVGQAYAAANYLQNFSQSLSETKVSANHMTPELSFFDCHACHHTTDNLRWRSQSITGLPPGSPKLTDSNFLILKSILDITSPGLQLELTSALRALHQSTAAGYDDAIRSSKNLSSIMNKIVDHINKKTFNKKTSRSILDNLLDNGRKNLYLDYTDAEQATMAVATILSVVDADNSSQSQLDQLYQAVDNQRDYNPSNFSSAMAKLRQAY